MVERLNQIIQSLDYSVSLARIKGRSRDDGIVKRERWLQAGWSLVEKMVLENRPEKFSRVTAYGGRSSAILSQSCLQLCKYIHILRRNSIIQPIYIYTELTLFPSCL